MSKQNYIIIFEDILQDTKLTFIQKFLLANIKQLSTTERGCFATNQHFATLIGCDKTTISKALSSLQKMGYIQIDIVKGTRNHLRYITPLNSQSSTIVKMPTPPCQNANPPLSKCQEAKEILKYNIKTTTTKSTRSRSNKREDLKSFKKNFINNYQGQTFTTHSLGWEKTTQFKLDDNNFIFNTVSHRTISKEDSLLIWTHLYQESLKAS